MIMEIISNLLQIIALLSFLSTIVFFITKGNRDFFKLIDDFNSNLPPPQKRAKKNDLAFMTHIDTTNMKMNNISTKDIDLFQKKLELFKYNRILFRKKKIISYSNNIQRLLRTSGWEKFGIATVQSLLEDDSFKSSKPYLFGYKIGQIIRF
jgi:hypothetical protein